MTEGISYYTQLIYLIASILKIITLMEEEISSSILGILDILLFLFSNIILFYFIFKFKNNNISQEKNVFDYRIIIAFSFILGYFICPSDFELSSNLADFSITISILLECLGMIPQMRMIRINKIIQKHLGIYICFLTLSRISRIIFWYLMTDFSDSSMYMIILLEIINVFFVSDILYNFLKNKNKEMIPYLN